MCNIYQNLYPSKSTNDEKIVVDYPKLNTKEKQICDKLSTLDECKDAVWNLKSKKKNKTNGWIWKTCLMSGGIRQGSPISALLYIFFAEILALKRKGDNL